MNSEILANWMIAQQRTLAEAAMDLHYERFPETALRFPKGSLFFQKCLEDVGYHLTYLREAIALSEPALFSDYIAWARVLLAGLGIPDGDLANSVVCLRDTLLLLQPEAASLVQPYLEAGLAVFREPLQSDYFQDVPLGVLGREYLALLLQGDRRAATRLILDAADSGVSLPDLYLLVFQPCQYEIGRLWQTNRISVAQEHLVTAATQMIMSQLSPRLFGTPRRGLTMVAACLQGDLHEIGLRMIADLLELGGWDTFFLGANTPIAGIVKFVKERNPDILAISTTMTFHLAALRELIEQARRIPGWKGKIIVGGYPFNAVNDLWRKIGADGHARDAREAIALANRLVGF